MLAKQTLERQKAIPGKYISGVSSLQHGQDRATTEAKKNMNY